MWSRPNERHAMPAGMQPQQKLTKIKIKIKKRSAIRKIGKDAQNTSCCHSSTSRCGRWWGENPVEQTSENTYIHTYALCADAHSSFAALNPVVAVATVVMTSNHIKILPSFDVVQQ